MQDPRELYFSRRESAMPKEASMIRDGDQRRRLRQVSPNNGWPLLTLVTMGAIFLIVMSCVTIVVLQLL